MAVSDKSYRQDHSLCKQSRIVICVMCICTTFVLLIYDTIKIHINTEPVEMLELEIYGFTKDVRGLTNF